MNAIHNHPVFTFYSYKGGATRTMSLANIAWYLANVCRLNVIAVDFDLEAPGLPYYYRRLLSESSYDKALGGPGIVDFFEQWRAAKRAGTTFQPPIDEWLIRVDSNSSGKQHEPTDRLQGSLKLLCAGSVASDGYHERIAELNMADLYYRYDGRQAVRTLKEMLSDRADIILVDSRTGLTDNGTVVMKLMADCVILYTVTNWQSVDGTCRVALNLTANEDDEETPPSVWLAVGRVAFAEAEWNPWCKEKAQWLAVAWNDTPLTQIPGAAFPAFMLPYRPEDSFDEKLIIDRAEDDPLAARFSGLAEAIAEMSFSASLGSLEELESQGEIRDSELDGLKRLIDVLGDASPVARLAALQRYAHGLIRARRYADAGEVLTEALMLTREAAYFKLPASDKIRRQRAIATEQRTMLLDELKSRRLVSRVNYISFDYSNSDFTNDIDSHKFHKADCQGAQFINARLAGLSFEGALLNNANFRGADLTKAVFRDADLRKADFTRATLLGADLTGALLSGACLKRTRLIGATVSSTAEVWMTKAAQRGSAPPTPEKFETMIPSTSVVTTVAFSSTGEELATGHENGMIQIWDASTARPIRVMSAHDGKVLAVAFSPDPEHFQLVSGSDDGTVRLWDLSDGKQLGEAQLVPSQQPQIKPEYSDGVTCVAFSADGYIAAAVYVRKKEGDIREIHTGAAVNMKFSRFAAEEEQPRIRCIAFSPDAQSIAVAADDGQVLHYNHMAKAVNWSRDVLPGYPPSALVFSPDGAKIAVGSTLGNIVLLDGTTGEFRHQIACDDNLSCIAFDRNGSRIAVGCKGGASIVSDLGTRDQFDRFETKTGSITGIAFDESGEKVVYAVTRATSNPPVVVGHRRTVDESPPEERRTEMDALPVEHVAFNESMTVLASSGGKQFICNLITGIVQVKELEKFHACDESTLEASVSNGHVWAHASKNSNKIHVKLQESKDVVREWAFQAHCDVVTSVAFGDDGNWLLSGSTDGTVRLWQLDHELRTFRFHVGLLLTKHGWVLFDPDGRYAVNGDVRGALWHAVGLCRFDLGELDEYAYPPLRVAAQELLPATVIDALTDLTTPIGSDHR